MAIQYKADQLLYKSRGPLDAKATVKTYAELINIDTWTHDDSLVAYNGMVVAVWLDKISTENNGLYFLFDPLVTTALKKPDVTNTANWHKITQDSDLKELRTKLGNVPDGSNLVEMLNAAIKEAKDYTDTKETSANNKIQ